VVFVVTLRGRVAPPDRSDRQRLEREAALEQR